MVEWSVGCLFADCWAWAGNVDKSTSMAIPYSRAWAFSATKTEDFLSTLTSRDTCQTLRLLVETSTLVYNWGPSALFPCQNSHNFLSLRSFAGSKLLRAFGKLLAPDSLANSSFDQLQGLFFLLFGAIIAVSYVTPEGESFKVNDRNISP